MSWWIVVLVCWAALNVGFVCGCWWRSRRGESLADRIAPYSVGVGGTSGVSVSWTWPDWPTASGLVSVTQPPPTRPPLAAVADPPRRLKAVK